jgi:hypothetical protein
LKKNKPHKPAAKPPQPNPGQNRSAAWAIGAGVLIMILQGSVVCKLEAQKAAAMKKLKSSESAFRISRSADLRLQQMLINLTKMAPENADVQGIMNKYGIR